MSIITALLVFVWGVMMYWIGRENVKMKSGWFIALTIAGLLVISLILQ